MSSNEDDYNEADTSGPSGLTYKKRRIQRACDICRRKKIRCDGVQMPGNRCSNCITFNYDCTYVEAAKKRGPPKGYVESLETRLEKLEKLLKRICPDESVLRELDIDLDQDRVDQPPLDPSPLVLSSHPRSSQSQPLDSYPYPPANMHNQGPQRYSRTPRDIATSVIRNYQSQYTNPAQSGSHNNSDVSNTYDDDDAHLVLADSLSKLTLEPRQHRFFGKSSGAMLIQTAIELKNEYEGRTGSAAEGAESSSAKLTNDVAAGGAKLTNEGSAGSKNREGNRRVMDGSDSLAEGKAKDKGQNCNISLLGSRRDEFWKSHCWEQALTDPIQPPTYTFPEEDLLRSLIDLYFEHVNLYLPLLHRPSFMRDIADGLHLRDPAFASNLLLVCAVGSRFSDDRRVLLDGEESWHSSGWKWFNQVQLLKKSALTPPGLHDLQFYCLTVQFLQGSSAPQACWTMVGIGIRLAQDVGAHRKRRVQKPRTVEDELWNRAFWVLTCMDRTISAALGRPCAIHDEDFDVDLPIDCDDEYWEHPDPEQCWKQPSGKPSLISAFLCYLKLDQVLAFSLRTIYSINKSKILLGFVGDQWEQHIVAELDSALNRFVDTVPDHLRWDPNRENPQHFNQSVVVWSAYYHIQILIHRPFIPPPNKPSTLSFPSLAICTNAARSCIHVVDVQYRRFPVTSVQVQMPVFTSGIVLLLSIWGGNKSGLSTDPKKEMADVHKSMAVLKGVERRWHSAGRLWDILYELASVGELPLPQTSSPNNKRERDADSPISSATSDRNWSPSLDGPRTFAGSKRVHKEMSSGSLRVQQQMQKPHPEIPQPPQPRLQQQQQQQQIPTMHASSLTSHGPQGSLVLNDPQRSVTSHPTQQDQQPLPELYALPVYSDELGRLPLYGQLKFSAQAPPPAPVPMEHDSGSFWYPFMPISGSDLQAPTQMRLSNGMGFSADSVASNVAVSSTGTPPRTAPSATASAPGVSMATQNEADFIFGQLAMGYPAPFSVDLQPTMLPMMDDDNGFRGMLPHELLRHADAHAASNTQAYQRLHDMMQERFGTVTGVGLSQTSASLPTHQDFVDNDSMAVWSGPPPGFE